LDYRDFAFNPVNHANPGSDILKHSDLEKKFYSFPVPVLRELPINDLQNWYAHLL
jgi:hypothetical protein